MLSNTELMENIDGIGEIIVKGLHDYFHTEDNIKAWQDFEAIGIQLNASTKKYS